MSIRADTFGWTAETIAALRQLWDDGHSTAEIGRRLGVSKNAIVGKAHRLDLPTRPSPIRKGGASTPRPARRPPVPRLADIMPSKSAVVLPARPPPQRAQPIAPQPAKPAGLFTASRPANPALPIGDKPCCWPIGDPGTPGFRFCTAPALIGKPYCDEHAQIAYRRLRPRNDDRMAAAD